MKYNGEQIGKLIKQERDKRKMTQAKLASKLHITNKQISNYEHGNLIPPLETLLNLCDIFGCELGYLLGEEAYQNETYLKTAICKKTGFTLDTVQAILKLVSDKWNGETNAHMLNRLFATSLMEEFLSDLSDVGAVVEEYESIDNKLNLKYGQEKVEEVLKIYSDPLIDYQHDVDYQQNNPEICQILFEVDNAIDKKTDLENTINIMRYRLNKTMEAMIDEMYPISKYRR